MNRHTKSTSLALAFLLAFSMPAFAPMVYWPPKTNIDPRHLETLHNLSEKGDIQAILRLWEKTEVKHFYDDEPFRRFVRSLPKDIPEDYLYFYEHILRLGPDIYTAVFLAGLKSPHEKIRRVSARVLGTLRVPAAAKIILPNLAYEPLSDEAFDAAARAVKELGDENYFVREAADKRLRELGPAARPFLVGSFGAPDIERRLRVRNILRDLNSRLLREVFEALANMGDRSFSGPIARLLADGGLTREAESAAIDTLGILGSPEHAVAIRPYLDDAELAAKAALALGRLRDARPAPRIEQLADKTKKNQCLQIVAALAMLGKRERFGKFLSYSNWYALREDYLAGIVGEAISRADVPVFHNELKTGRLSYPRHYITVFCKLTVVCDADGKSILISLINQRLANPLQRALDGTSFCLNSLLVGLRQDNALRNLKSSFASGDEEDQDRVIPLLALVGEKAVPFLLSHLKNDTKVPSPYYSWSLSARVSITLEKITGLPLHLWWFDTEKQKDMVVKYMKEKGLARESEASSPSKGPKDGRHSAE